MTRRIDRDTARAVIVRAANVGRDQEPARRIELGDECLGSTCPRICARRIARLETGRGKRRSRCPGDEQEIANSIECDGAPEFVPTAPEIRAEHELARGARRQRDQETVNTAVPVGLRCCFDRERA